MTDNLSINVNLNSQSQPSNATENTTRDSLQQSSEMSTEEKLLSMETPMSRILAQNNGGVEYVESAATGSRSLGSGGGSDGVASGSVTANGAVAVGDSTFNYTTVGPEGYAEQVHELLVDIASTEAGAALLTEITSNRGNVQFSYGTGDASSRGSLLNRDTVITFNPAHRQEIATTTGSREAQPKFIVAHELHHAWKNTLSCWFGCSRPLILSGSVPNGLNPWEAHAVRYTNMIRTQADAGYQRTHYNGIAIP